MAINPTVTRNGDGSWAFAWTAGTTPYSIWLDGRLLTNSLTTESYEISDPLYEDSPPPLEILNAGDASENSAYPPRVVLQWRGLQSATEYGIEQYIGAAWVEQSQVSEDGSGYYQWESAALADVTTHQFRVTAYSSVGAAGTPISFDSFVVRNPGEPSVSFTITAGDVVVS